MTHTEIKNLLNSAIDSVSSSICNYAKNSGKDFSRNRKLPADKLISFLIAEGSSTTKNELLDFFGMDSQSPSSSAFFQQRVKLKPEALEAVFGSFSRSVSSCNDKHPGYRLIAADGSTASYFSRDKYSPPDEYFISPGNSIKGAYSIHINAFQDLDTHLYTDALLQPVHQKDEFRAFCTIVDRHPVVPGSKNIYIGDRGYCSYNNMAHVIQNEQFFLFRTKDIHQKGLVGKFDFPDDDTFDITVNVTLVRSHSSKIDCGDTYRRFIDSATSFDYLEYGSNETYPLSFRVVRVKLSGDSYECLVTNLSKDEFPPDRLKKLYYARWNIEGRQYDRLQTAHFRRPRYFIYRAA